ncbi:MAG: hypothetical protein WC044_10615 [Crocinitomicaceae bacterium]
MFLKDFLRLVFVVLLLVGQTAHAQESSLRERFFDGKKDTVFLDSMIVYPNSLTVFCGTQLLSKTEYEFINTAGKLVLHSKCGSELKVQYRVLPIPLESVYQKRDTSYLYATYKGDRDKFLIKNTATNTDVFGGSGLNKSGSISRGITFGNNQNLGVNSTLNLELSGDIAPNLKMLAVVSDNNLPIQPDGNTNQLREFDQVFIQIYNDNLKLIAGDFWLRKPKGYFMTYQKRAQGLTLENTFKTASNGVWKTQISGALSKGKFNRQIIQGVEGNQGPYRLVGAESEPYIVVLSGTEQVFIDGKLLERGQEFDYVINYNSAEVTFTSRKQITKDVRIVVEFQYSDQNYARSVVQASANYTGKKMDFWLNGYSEQDAKNQSLQQTLSLEQKQLLSEVGDSLFLARSSSIDSVGYIDNLILYQLIDSMGYDSVLVFTADQDLGVYKAVFQQVTQGQGDYILDSYNALGKVYKWVMPIGGVSQGNFSPSRLLVAPKKQQLVTMGATYRLTKKWEIENEAAMSVYDINTFSRLDANDNRGFANRFKLKGVQNLGKDSISNWKMETNATVEYLDKNFQPVQQYRAVEFDRDWNTRNRGYLGQQLFVTASNSFKKKDFGFMNVEAQHFEIGKDFTGYKAQLDGKWNQKGFQAQWIGSYLVSEASSKNDYLRHKIDISQKIGKIRIGYKDDHERNVFKQTNGLITNSYQFFDYQFYLANIDSSKNDYKLFYRERFDFLPDSSRLNRAAKGTTMGGEFTFKQLKNQRLTVITSYRELKILDSTLINQAPENSLLGRIDYELRAFKNSLTINTFYEAGSGLELKREFLYIKVNDGQGIYTWIDYNNDGVKDLNEFEVAQYIDQASYIRVFTPSSNYVKTFSNEFNQSVFWRPERIWASKTGILKYAALFSDQVRYRVNRKTTGLSGVEAFNPSQNAVRDTNLISTSSSLRNTVFFNRTSNIFTGEYNFQNVQSKTLLASGFDARTTRYNEVSSRLNISKIFSLEYSYQRGEKDVEADYVAGRNYAIGYYFHKPTVSFQPNTKFRWSIEGKYTEKKNSADLGGQKAYLGEIGSSIKYNQAEKGSLQANVKTVNIVYRSDPNTPLGFEMLEALKPGVNYTWTVGYQRSLSNNLQISLQYSGRKSEGNKAIHSGGMEVRAFF